MVLNLILSKATEAKNKTEEAQLEEERRLTSMEAATNVSKTMYTDEDGITVTIPEGFAVSQKTGENKVETGLVIIDKSGNEYVWIPVTKNENGIPTKPYEKTQGKLKEGSDIEIQLGRYDFDTTTGKPSGYSGSYTEDTSASHEFEYKNIIAKDIEGFKESVEENGGYCIARYEAGIEGGTLTSEDNTEENPDWTGYTGENMKLVSKQGQQVWNYITQNRAANLCRELADTNGYEGVTSDLLNSYAWDTALVFIQKCGTDSNYANQVGKATTSSTPSKTGKSILAEGNGVGETDVQCNVYDMAGNCYEWTTETTINFYFPCVFRGGVYSNTRNYASGRYSCENSDNSINLSFRSLLYLSI